MFYALKAPKFFSLSILELPSPDATDDIAHMSMKKLQRNKFDWKVNPLIFENIILTLW